MASKALGYSSQISGGQSHSINLRLNESTNYTMHALAVYGKRGKLRLPVSISQLPIIPT